MSAPVHLSREKIRSRKPSIEIRLRDSCGFPIALSADAAKAMDLPFVTYDEPGFRYALNEDAMATEKLAEGIRAFAVDAVKLEKLIQAI